MKKIPQIKVLIVEHNPADIELLAYELKKDGLPYLSLVVKNEADYVAALTTFVPDIILSDFSIPSFDGATAFKIKEAIAPSIPFILVTGTLGEEVAVAFIKDGVTDYVLKDKLYTLLPKVKRALMEADNSRQKEWSDEQQEFDLNNMNALINSTNDLMWSVDRNLNLITSNIPFDEMGSNTFGKAIEKGQDVLVMAQTPERSMHFKRLYERAFAGEIFTQTEHDFLPTEFWSEISYYPIRKGKKVIGTACHSRDITKIKSAEQQIARDQKRFRALIENGADAVVILTAEGKPFYISPTVESVLGYTEAEALELDLFALFHPDDVKWAIGVWEQIMVSPGVPITVNPSRMKHKDGTYLWLEGTLTNLLHDPAVNGIVDNFRDVTKRKAAEDALQLTQFAVDNAADAILWMSPDAQIVNVNEAACQMLGYAREELMDLVIMDIDPNYDLKKWTPHFKELRHKGALFFETAQQAKDGRLIPVEVRANYIKFGEAEFNCAVVRDISDRKKSENKLVQSEARLREAQALSHVCNWEVDLVTNVNTWSEELLTIFELKHEEVDPSFEAFLTMVHYDDYEAAKECIDKSFQTFEESSITVRVRTRNGNIRYVFSEWQFEFDKNKKASRIYGIFQDVTDRKKAEEEREKLTDALIQRNRDLEQFTFIISHNLRAPIANIIGYSDGLLEEAISSEEQKEFLQGLSTSVLQMDTTIKDINAILQARLSLNEIKEPVSFSKIIDAILDNTGNAINQQQVQITRDFSEVDDIHSLKIYLNSIFYNLIDNSIKYSKPNEDILIEIKSKKKKGKTILTFADNGLGFDMETKGDKIFGLYNRFHPHIEGKGMGLYMVKTQVEAIGGKITVTSEINKGTQFTIVFEN